VGGGCVTPSDNFFLLSHDENKLLFDEMMIVLFVLTNRVHIKTSYST